MKRSRKSSEQLNSTPAAPKSQEETSGLKLRIEELEPRLTPQSTAGLLD
jgi:hypothetical protein